MNVHEQFADDLAMYALGSLSGDERTALEKHLQDCATCRRELDVLRGDMALLALSTTGPVPPARSRKRLADAIAAEPRRTRRSRPRSWALLPWAVAAALAVVALVFWRSNSELRDTMSGLRQQSEEQQLQLQQARDIVSTLTATDALRVTLVAAKTPPQPQGKAIYVRDRSSLVFLATNLPALPPGKAYELWLIPVSGAPVPAGVFKPDVHGSATVLNPPLPPRAEAKAFAITMEPEQGSPAPTSQPIMLGSGE
ncbi:MAG TPA: anti-sigma factor [Terriglobales bacterium]|nr:anti-sigma factor [Terriglobales bacterium]